MNNKFYWLLTQIFSCLYNYLFDVPLKSNGRAGYSGVESAPKLLILSIRCSQSWIPAGDVVEKRVVEVLSYLF